jgi:hypothetical protein
MSRLFVFHLQVDPVRQYEAAIEAQASQYSSPLGASNLNARNGMWQAQRSANFPSG